jgi:thiol-disulfide isomerase/thioredoxin
MNSAIALLIIIPLALLWFWQWTTWRRAKRSEGEPVPDTAAVDGGITSAHRVYFFHATHCAPCRAITPLVDRLRAEYPNLIKVDVARHTELTRNFGIAATPSFIAVAEGRVTEVKLGPPSEGWLRAHLATHP